MTWNTTRRVLTLVTLAQLAVASVVQGKADPQEEEAFGQIERQLDRAKSAPYGDLKGRTATPMAIPDIYGPGAVLTVGNVVTKVTNYGLIGNPFTNISNDPSGQWPGASGVEYLNFILLAVGGVNPTATDPTAVRRVSYNPEWWPPTPDPEDRMYRAYDGIIGGNRLVNDDSDNNQFTGEPNIDEDFLDGRDNDGDGRIDEDYAAVGQLMYSCVMRDDTPAAYASSTAEAHAALSVEMRQLAWAYSVPGFTDFNVVQLEVYNRSGHTLDSMYFGFRVDVDAGPAASSTYFSDDQDVPFFPSGVFPTPVESDDARLQSITTASGTTDLCPVRNIRVNGFSVVDNDGDEGRTSGVASLLLFGHTVDPLGLRAPTRVGFRAFRSFIAGTPYASNGNPSTDQQRFEFLSSRQNIDQETGLINAEPGDQQGDYTAWSSVGPFLDVPDGGMITATIGFAVSPATHQQLLQYPIQYGRYQAGLTTLDDLLDAYPALENAFTAQVAYEGIYEEPRPGFTELVPDCHGCETGVQLPVGSSPTVMVEQCPDREATPKQVTDNGYTWFDFDCDPCTGVFDEVRGGLYLRHWNAESPPPSPNMNVASSYNYSDNPNRVTPAGDNTVTLAWDNVSETTADPKSGQFDFRAYRVWKVSGWQRPVGASGPNDEDWALLAEFRMFDYLDSNFTHDPGNDTLICPKVFIPDYRYPAGHPHCSDAIASPLQLASGGCRDTATVGICLRSGDFWDKQSGYVLRPENVDCVRDTNGLCIEDVGRPLGEETLTSRTRYPIGRYRIVDRETKNGFIYFYSVTAGDSTAGSELYGRRSAVESDHVTPQWSANQEKGVWVVPNPYRGYRNILERPSAWDLVPNATDPTGTHIDFLGLPSGSWKIKVFTVSGDLVAELTDRDPVNESVRGSVTGPDGVVRPGFNRQQDNPNDGQARWNLISRNGQDVVSGIYIFVVDSRLGTQRGKFVVIR